MLFKAVVGMLLTFALAGASCGQVWERLGPEGGMVVSLGAGTTGVVYLGTADGHVFASEDGASTWRLRGRVGNRLDAVVTRLVVDAQDANQVFAAVWYREAAENGGVFRSDDGGRNWSASGLAGEAVRALEAAPSNRAELVAGTRTGVFRSRDRGATWQRISPAGDPELRNVDSLAIDPRNPDVIYAGTYHLPWRTRDSGKSWEPVIAGIIDDSDIMSLRLDAANPDRVYMSACSGIYRSENQGGEWTKLQGIPYAARRTQTIVQDSANPGTLYAGTTEGAWVTHDNGETWVRTSPKDWVVNGVLVLPAGSPHPGRVVMGTESGIQVSDNRGETFTAANRGFAHVVVKQLVGGLNGDGPILALVQRNGWELLKSADRGESWTPVSLGEEKSGRPVLIADQIEEVLASPWGWILRMTGGRFWIEDEKTSAWKEWKPRIQIPRPRASATSQGISPRSAAPEIATATIAFSEDSAIVASRQGVLRCNEAGVCTRLKAFSAATAANSLWTSRSGRDLVVLHEGKFGFSSDSGETASWRDLPVGATQALWADVTPAGGQATFVAGTAVGLFVSADGSVRWLSVKNGLPAGRMEAWLATPGFWLVSERSGGLYLSGDRGASWTRVDRDEERSRIAGLLDLGNGSVMVGSQSEGLLLLKWTVDAK